MINGKRIKTGLLVIIYTFILSFLPSFLLGFDEKITLIFATITGIISIISPSIGIFFSFLALFSYTLYKIPIVGILLSPLYITLAAKSFRYWHVTPLIFSVFLIHIYFPSVAILSLPIILLALTFVEPQDSIVIASIFSYAVLISLYLFNPENTLAIAGIFIIRTSTLPSLKPFETSFDYLMDILVTSSSILLSFSQTIIKNDAAGLLQIIGFTASGFIASQLFNSEPSRIKRFLLLPLSIIPVFICHILIFNGLDIIFQKNIIYFLSETLLLSFLMVFTVNKKENKIKVQVSEKGIKRKILYKNPKINMVETLLRKELSQQNNRPLLVIGPPGCGKTYTVEKAAINLDLNTYIVSEDLPIFLRDLLREQSRKIIIIKEIQDKPKIISLFQKYKNISSSLIVFTSSNPLKLLRYMNINHDIGSILYIPPPDTKEIENFLRKELRENVIINYHKIAPLFKNYSYNQLKKVVQHILRYCSIYSPIDLCELGYSEILDIIEKIKPDLTPQIYNNLEKFIINSPKPIIRPSTLTIYS